MGPVFHRKFASYIAIEWQRVHLEALWRQAISPSVEMPLSFIYFTESNPLINLEDKIMVENYYSAFDRYAQEEKYGDLLENDR